MGLRKRDRRILAALERDLRRQDPELDRLSRTLGARRTPRRPRPGYPLARWELAMVATAIVAFVLLMLLLTVLAPAHRP